MKTLNSFALNPISVLNPPQPLKKPTNPHLKFPKPHFHTPTLLPLLSSVFPSPFAHALTYEEALNQSTTSPPSFPDLDVTGALDSIISFGVENPGLIAAGAAVLLAPIVLGQVFGQAKPWGVESARNAYEKMGVDESAQLLDIRAAGEIRKVGRPDVRGLKKKPVSVVYNGEDKPGFLKKLGLKFKEPEKTTLFILDKFDGSSELVAELVTINGFKAAYAIKGGAEGPRGWMNSGLPWIPPKKSLSFDFDSLTDAIDGVFGEGADAISVIFGIAAATGLGVLAFSEVETILEFLGSAALVQLVSKKFLYAEDREKTLKEVDEFLTSKIGPNELVDDIKQIGKALLPSFVFSKALPSSTIASQEEPVSAIAVEPVKPVEPISQVNSVPNAEVKEESPPKPPRPLSPYPYYPDFKPPTSPSPSKP